MMCISRGTLIHIKSAGHFKVSVRDNDVDILLHESPMEFFNKTQKNRQLSCFIVPFTNIICAKNMKKYSFEKQSFHLGGNTNFKYPLYLSLLPRCLSGRESACQCRRCRFEPWVGKILWRRTWQPTLVFLGIPWTEEPDGLQSMGLQRVRHEKL